MIVSMSNAEYLQIFEANQLERSELVREVECQVRILLDGSKEFAAAGALDIAEYFREQGELGKWQAITIAEEEKKRRCPFYDKGELTGGKR